MRILYFLPLMLAGGFNFAAPVFAQSAASNDDLRNEVAELKSEVGKLESENSRLRALSGKLDELERKVAARSDAARGNELSPPTVTAGPNGFGLASPDGGYQFRVGGWLQADGRFYNTGTKPDASTFLIRRARPYLEGTLDRFYDFRLMADFGQGKTTLEDAFADIHYWDAFRMRAGKFKEPVGLERLQNDRYLMFAERALTVNLVPDRDLGAAAHGELFGQKLAYEFGVFNGVPDDAAAVDIDNNDAKDFAGRIFIQPFADSQYAFASKLGFGVAGTYGSERAVTLDTYKTAGQTTFFTYNKNVHASGDRFRLAPQLNFYRGPVGFQSEFIENAQQVELNSPNSGAGRLHTLDNQAWQIAGSYLITGEDARYAAPIVPNHPFSPFSNGLGAWELAARIDELTVDSDAFRDGLADSSTSSRRAFEWMLGVNWYPNRNLKMQLDYERTSFAGGAPGGRDREDESAVLSELQVAF
jgi:phosphate-selective porin OprO/OprP